MFHSDFYQTSYSDFYLTSYDRVCTMLRGVLRDSAQAGSSAEEGVGSPRCRASGALYGLLRTHRIDQRGRCRVCCRRGVVFVLRRQRCQVHAEASFWLRQPGWLLSSRVAAEWGLGQQAPPAATAAPGNPPRLVDSDGVRAAPERHGDGGG